MPASPFIINEVGNASVAITDSDTDWVELKNVSDAEQSLKNYTLSIVNAANSTGKELVSFKDKDYKVPAGGVFLIVDSDPKNTNLASGVNVALAEADRNKFGSKAHLFIASSLELPNTKSLLVLRNTADARNGTDDAHKNIIDIAGNYYGDLQNAKWNTALYPLQASEAGHGNVFKDLPEENGFAEGKVYARDAGKAGTAENAFSKAGFTGIGWDRNVAKRDGYGGTPGFDNGANKEKGLGTITISEVMANDGNGRYPQWIELRNSSMTLGVNLNGWKLRVENVGQDVDTRQNFTLGIPDGYQIPPNQTLLIVARTASKSDNIQDERVINLAQPATKSTLEVTGNRFMMLSEEGFTLKLFEKDQDPASATPVDMVTVTADQLTEDMIGTARERISLVRAYASKTTPGNLFPADNSEQAFVLQGTYYGSSDDIGTPGNVPGGVLPVSLSSFRPERDKATGEIVVRWVTQSELNNAGFNILRSETKNGEFTVVNVKGIIPGQGTTSEKHVYAWTDTTAKPNVVYYYQIEDVSLDGERTTLATTHLRGNVNAAGKLTTTWGDLKTQ